MGKVLPLLKFATSTLYRDPGFFNTTITTTFSPITKSVVFTTLLYQYKSAAIPFSVQSLLILCRPLEAVQYFTESSLNTLVSSFCESRVLFPDFVISENLNPSLLLALEGQAPTCNFYKYNINWANLLPLTSILVCLDS
jgi:hypothetical protein